MKKNLTKLLSLMLLILTFTSISYSQNITATPSPNPSSFNFEITNYTPSHNGVVLSHLWWFGDNGYSFGATPTHTFSDNNPRRPSVIATEGYGTAGPPPLRLASDISSPNPISTVRSLDPNATIRIQNYRKAVVNDTIYLILTYAQPLGAIRTARGEINLELDAGTTFLNTFFNNNPHFLPNKENLSVSANNSSQLTITYEGLEDEERSILIPLIVDQSRKEFLTFTTSINMEGVNFSEKDSMDELILPIRRSQDPNQMSEISHSDDNTNGDVYTPCEFGGEQIDYTIDFQNIGEGPTYYVQVICQLDDKVDLNSIDNIILPSKYNSINEIILPDPLNNMNNHEAYYYINHDDKTITFEFHGLRLYGTADPLCKNLMLTKSSVSFSINAKPNYVFGPPIISYSTIIFDENEAIKTDTVSTICDNPTLPGGFPDIKETKTSPVIWAVIGIGVLLGGILLFSKLKK